MSDGASSLLILRRDIPDGTITEHNLQVTLQRWEMWAYRPGIKTSNLGISDSAGAVALEILWGVKHWNTLQSDHEILWGAISWLSRQNADKLGWLGGQLMSLGTPATWDIVALPPLVLLFKVGLGPTQSVSPGSVPQEQLEQSNLREQWSRCVQLPLTIEGMCLLWNN